MSQERPIEDWLGELPEPERTEALEARRKCLDRGGLHARNKTARDKASALFDGFSWIEDTGNANKMLSVYGRAQAGEFDAPPETDGPSEVDRLRARVAELEGALSMTLQYVKHASTTYLGKEYDQEITEQREANEYTRSGIARSILNKK